MSPIDLAVAAAIAELHRQAEISGCTTEDNGSSAQVDGSFEVEPLVRAVIAAIREPSQPLIEAGMGVGIDPGPYSEPLMAAAPQEIEQIWATMIDVLLSE